MKITELRTYLVEGSNDHWLWLSLKTDEGLEGWGEVTGSSNDTVLAQYLQTISGNLIGENPLNIVKCMQKIEAASYPDNGSNRFISTARSGINQALWDLKARYFELPLHWLLGGHGEKKIRLYANLNRGLLDDRSPEALLKNGSEAIQDGFSIIKCTPFDEVTPFSDNSAMKNGLDRIKKLASSVPVHQVAIDCHERFNRGHMVKLLYEISGIGDPHWIEDPFSVEKEQEQELFFNKYPNIRWATGETSYNVRDILKVANDRLVDIVMPDVKHCGGVGALKTIISLVESSGLRISLHNPSGPIATAFSAQLLALAKHAELLEFPYGSVPERSEFLTTEEPIINGTYLLTNKPGIGVTPCYDKLRECGLVWNEGSWVRIKDELVRG